MSPSAAARGEPHYVVATVKPWNISAFQTRSPALAGQWHLLEEPGRLSTAYLKQLSARYVFFPHWSWRVPNDVLGAFECVCFHMTDVPYGRGGSPLQNLIERGHEETMLTALRMVPELDAGPVYLKRPLSLAGNADAIYRRAADLVYDMIAEIIAREPEGEVTAFQRRTPHQSELPASTTAKVLYDHIRMLDAETYPRAFLRHGDFRLEFSQAALDGETVSAKVIFQRQPKKVAE